MPMSNTDTALDASAAIERLLEQHHGAQGRGLHEKVSSVADRLSPALVSQIRTIATVRNQVVHERRPMDDPERFQAVAREVVGALTQGRLGSPTQVLALDGRTGWRWMLSRLGMRIEWVYWAFVVLSTVVFGVGGFRAGYENGGVTSGLVMGIGYALLPLLLYGAIARFFGRYLPLAVVGLAILMASSCVGA